MTSRLLIDDLGSLSLKSTPLLMASSFCALQGVRRHQHSLYSAALPAYSSCGILLIGGWDRNWPKGYGLCLHQHWMRDWAWWVGTRTWRCGFDRRTHWARLAWWTHLVWLAWFKWLALLTVFSLSLILDRLGSSFSRFCNRFLVFILFDCWDSWD